MYIQGVRDVYGANVSLGADGSGSISFETDRRSAQRLLGKTVMVEAGIDRFRAILTAINDSGTESGLSTVSGMALVQHAMRIPYRDDSTNAPNQAFTNQRQMDKAFTGRRWKSIDAATGELSGESIQNIIQRVINVSQDEFSEIYSQNIEVSFSGDQLTETIDVLEWSGDTIGEIIEKALANEKDVIKRVRGNTLDVVKINWNNINRRITNADIVGSYDAGLNLENCVTRVYIEGIDATTISGTVTLNANVVNGLPKLVSNVPTSFEVKNASTGATMNIVLNERFSAFNSWSADSGTNISLRVGYDTRHQAYYGYAGDAYERYGWKSWQVIIDDNYGRVAGSDATANYDRRGMATSAAQKAVMELSKLLWTGNATLPQNYRVNIGDVILLPGISDPVVVMSKSYSIDKPHVDITFGHVTGQRVVGIKERTNINQINQNAARISSEQIPPKQHQSPRYIKGTQGNKSKTYWTRQYTNMRSKYGDLAEIQDKGIDRSNLTKGQQDRLAQMDAVKAKAQTEKTSGDSGSIKKGETSGTNNAPAAPAQSPRQQLDAKNASEKADYERRNAPTKTVSDTAPQGPPPPPPPSTDTGKSDSKSGGESKGNAKSDNKQSSGKSDSGKSSGKSDSKGKSKK